MHYLELVFGFGFLLLGLWFGVQTLQSLGTESIWVDIEGKRVELIRTRDPDRFRSAIRFQAGTALGCSALGAFILALKLTGLD